MSIHEKIKNLEEKAQEIDVKIQQLTQLLDGIDSEFKNFQSIVNSQITEHKNDFSRHFRLHKNNDYINLINNKIPFTHPYKNSSFLFYKKKYNLLQNKKKSFVRKHMLEDDIYCFPLNKK